jgi:hypothetical protein
MKMGTTASPWRYDEGSDAAIDDHRRPLPRHANFEVEHMNQVMAYYAITWFRFQAT